MSYLNDVDELSAEHVDFRMNVLTEELGALRQFKREFPGSSDEWKASAVFLKEGQLRKYAQDQAKKQLNMNIWPLKFIDWDRVVEDIKKSHGSVFLDDVKYWVIKKPADVSSMSNTNTEFPIGDDFVVAEFGVPESILVQGVEFDDPESVLVQNDDCHWYVIPHKNLEEWTTWVTEGSEDDHWMIPEWATSVGENPSLVIFKEHRIS